MIVVDNLSKSYAKQTLFESISFKVNRKERVGVVGRNGHGKTTLFRLVTGEEEADSGTITMPRNYRIGTVAQKLDLRADTVRGEASRGLGAEADGEMWRVEKVLAGLGFDPGDLGRHPLELSGGYQVRLNLARVLLSDNQMLLLDEPNNYLDITSIRWLERFLVDWPGELMLITHDRSFMDKVVTHVLGIHRKKARKVAGDTAKYYSQIAMEEEVYEKTRQNDERKQKEMDLFITRFRAKARLAGMVQSRIKSLEKMEKKDKLVAIKDLEFTFTERPFHHKYAMTLDGVTFGYEPGKPLLRNLTLSIGARDRVFVIGRNGKGKTTLLKLMAGVLEPGAGEVVGPQSLAVGYYEQTNVSSLVDANTVLDEIASANTAQDPKFARLIAGAMIFEGDDALKPVRVLSGGEKSRVMLGKIIATPVNLLLLDEPTNHLDLESSDALLEALDSFDGAVVMVTHNEMFLQALAERLVVFQNGGITVYEGGYGRFLDKVGWNEETERPGKDVAEPEAPADRKNPRGMRKLRSGIIAERSRVLKPLEKRMAEVEAEIERNDSELRAMNEAVVEASRAKNGARVVALSKSMHRAKSSTDRLFMELEWLTREHKEKNAEFAEKLTAKAPGEEGEPGEGPGGPPGRV
jgi:ATP-binding cassette subfamily F protein 3